MKKKIYIFGACFFLMVNFAYSKSLSQKEYFLKNNNTGNNYNEIYPISFEVHKKYIDQEEAGFESIFNVLKTKCSPDSLKVIKGLEKKVFSDIDERKSYIGNFHESEIITGDEIYYFKYKDLKITEYGVLILNNGTIRKRWVEQIVGGEPKKTIKKKRCK